MTRAGPMLWALSAAVLFGASMPLSKTLLGSLGPLGLGGLLYLGAAVATLPFAAPRGSALWRLDAANRRRLAGVAFFGGGLAPILLLSGLSLAPAGSVSLWLALEVPATALLAYVFFEEHVNRRVWTAIGLVAAGSVLLAMPNGFALAPAALLVGAACLCWGLDNNLTALIDGITPVQTTVVKGLTAGIVNLSLGIWAGTVLPAVSVCAAALAVGAISYGLSLVLYINAAQHLGATRSQVIFASAPFWGVALSWALLAEPLSPFQAGAGTLMVLALWLMHSERHAHSHTHVHKPLLHTHGHSHEDTVHDHSHGDLPERMWHTHEHAHTTVTHAHDHDPDLHHRHPH